MTKICERFLRNTSEYTPYTKDSELYLQVLTSIVDIENWEYRTDLERPDFEKHLSNNYELEMAYVDLYSKSAWFALVEFEMVGDKYEFYCMIDMQRIVLIFYKKSSLK